jgi:two-component system, OmpR family, response regulator MprA
VAEPLRVLVIEDDEEIRFIVGSTLADEGWEVREAADGLQALALLAEWPPDVILLDVMIPGMDARSIRAEQRSRGLALEVPLVVMSASRHTSEIADELAACATLHKPFDLDDLVATVLRASAAR